MHYREAAISKSGGRSYNEDSWGSEQGCWVVADGLGGHGGGEVASSLAVESILAAFREEEPVLAPETLQTYLEAAEGNILIGQEQEGPRLAGMRTTAVVLLSDGREALWAHIGDTRLYHFRGGRVVFQTLDHSVPQLLVELGEITPEQIRQHEDRNRLIRSLGNGGRLEPALAEQSVTLQPADAFLLCTDGFWEYILETEMEVDLAKSLSPEEWLGRMEARLLWRAPDWHDNYTALAVWVEAE